MTYGLEESDLVVGPSRATVLNRSTVYLRSGTVTGDSLIGEADEGKRPRTALALTDTRKLERQRVSKTRTFLAILGALAGAGLVYENLRPLCRDCIEL